MKTNIKYRNKIPMIIEHSYAWSMTIGMSIGFLITIFIGTSTDHVAVGIASGPALGSGFGFAIHGFLNRKNENITTQENTTKRTIYFVAFTLLGILLFASALFYLMN